MPPGCYRFVGRGSHCGPDRVDLRMEVLNQSFIVEGKEVAFADDDMITEVDPEVV